MVDGNVTCVRAWCVYVEPTDATHASTHSATIFTNKQMFSEVVLPKKWRLLPLHTHTPMYKLYTRTPYVPHLYVPAVWSMLCHECVQHAYKWEFLFDFGEQAYDFFLNWCDCLSSTLCDGGDVWWWCWCCGCHEDEKKNEPTPLLLMFRGEHSLPRRTCCTWTFHTHTHTNKDSRASIIVQIHVRRPSPIMPLLIISNFVSLWIGRIPAMRTLRLPPRWMDSRELPVYGLRHAFAYPRKCSVCIASRYQLVAERVNYVHNILEVKKNETGTGYLH